MREVFKYSIRAIPQTLPLYYNKAPDATFVAVRNDSFSFCSLIIAIKKEDGLQM